MYYCTQSDIDSCPNSELQSVFNVLEVLKVMPKEFESREWVVNELGNRGIENHSSYLIHRIFLPYYICNLCYPISTYLMLTYVMLSYLVFSYLISSYLILS